MGEVADRPALGGKGRVTWALNPADPHSPRKLYWGIGGVHARRAATLGSSVAAPTKGPCSSATNTPERGQEQLQGIYRDGEIHQDRVTNARL